MVIGRIKLKYFPPRSKRTYFDLKFSSVLPDQHLKRKICSVEASSDRELRNTKATKNDDAEVPAYLWNEAIVQDGDPKKLAALDVVRCFALRWWKKHTTKDFKNWLNQTYSSSQRFSGDYIKDEKAGVDCLTRFANSSWWEWSVGSRPLFWRWPEECRTTIRDGVKLWIKDHCRNTRFLKGEKRTQLQEKHQGKVKYCNIQRIFSPRGSQVSYLVLCSS